MPTKKATEQEPKIPTIPAAIEKQLLSVEMLPVKDLIIDPTYQRDIQSGEVSRLVKDWNWLACGMLAVSLRPVKGSDLNQYAVLDGQQRLSAIRQIGFKEAPCRIYVDLTPTQEAELFELLNNAKKPGFNDLFKSRLSRGEPIAKAINMAVEQAGYHLDPERRHGNRTSAKVHFYIQTMSELERIYKMGGSTGGVPLIMDTLKFIRDAWAPEYLSQQAEILPGVAIFLKRYPSAVRKEMIEKLRRVGLNKITQMALQYRAVHGKATGGGSRGFAFCEAMLILYNSNRQEARRIKSKA